MDIRLLGRIFSFCNPIYYYTLYRVSRDFRKALKQRYLDYPNLQTNETDILAMVIFSEKNEAFVDDGRHIIVLTGKWSYKKCADYSYYSLIKHFWVQLFFHQHKPLVDPHYLLSIVSKQRDTTLFRHLIDWHSWKEILTSGGESGDKIIKLCIRDYNMDLFDYIYPEFIEYYTNKRERLFLHQRVTDLLTYALSIDEFYQERRPFMFKLLGSGSIDRGRYMELLKIIIRRRDVEMVETMLSMTQETPLGERNHRVLETYVWRYFPQDEWERIISIIATHFPSYERGDRILWLNGEKVEYAGGLVNYEDIIYVVRCIVKNGGNLLKKFSNIGELLSVSYKGTIIKYLSLIRYDYDDLGLNYDLMTSSGRDRFVIYKLCEIFNIRYKRIDKKGTRCGVHCRCIGWICVGDKRPYTYKVGVTLYSKGKK